MEYNSLISQKRFPFIFRKERIGWIQKLFRAKKGYELLESIFSYNSLFGIKNNALS